MSHTQCLAEMQDEIRWHREIDRYATCRGFIFPAGLSWGRCRRTLRYYGGYRRGVKF